VTAVVGGMSFRLDEERRRDLEKWSTEALALTRDLLGVTKELLDRHLARTPQLGDKLSSPTLYMGTVADGALNFYDGPLRVIDTAARPVAEFESRDYAGHLVERALEWSYMKPVYMTFAGKEYPYRVGTLARNNAADRMETPLAQAELEAFRAAAGRPCHQAVMQIHARLIELLYACEKAQALAADRAILGESRVPAEFKGSRGIDHVEAPRGTLIHDYQIDDQGIVRAANLVVATQQNYTSINRSIQQAAEAAVASGASDEVLLAAVEFGIRCYDPCLSCATHAVGRMPLDIEIARDGEIVRRVRRAS
jgi:F420-non-reducing hydrogenase large subunit